VNKLVTLVLVITLTLASFYVYKSNRENVIIADSNSEGLKKPVDVRRVPLQLQLPSFDIMMPPVKAEGRMTLNDIYNEWLSDLAGKKAGNYITISDAYVIGRTVHYVYLFEIKQATEDWSVSLGQTKDNMIGVITDNLDTYCGSDDVMNLLSAGYSFNGSFLVSGNDVPFIEYTC